MFFMILAASYGMQHPIGMGRGFPAYSAMGPGAGATTGYAAAPGPAPGYGYGKFRQVTCRLQVKLLKSGKTFPSIFCWVSVTVCWYHLYMYKLSLGGEAK